MVEQAQQSSSQNLDQHLRSMIMNNIQQQPSSDHLAPSHRGGRVGRGRAGRGRAGRGSYEPREPSAPTSPWRPQQHHEPRQPSAPTSPWRPRNHHVPPPPNSSGPGPSSGHPSPAYLSGHRPWNMSIYGLPRGRAYHTHPSFQFHHDSRDDPVVGDRPPSRGLVMPGRPGRGRGFAAAHAAVSADAPDANERPYHAPRHGRGGSHYSRQHSDGRAAEIEAQGAFLKAVADDVLPEAIMSDDEFTTKDEFRRRLERLCQDVATKTYPNPPSLTLPAFGSFASTYGMPGSDMDLALVGSHMPDFPRHLEKAVLEAGHGARLLTRTRVPILKICEKPTPELYAALRAERQKWDDMTPEEREEYDKGPTLRKDESQQDSQTNETSSNGNNDKRASSVEATTSSTSDAVPSEPKTPEPSTPENSTNASSKDTEELLASDKPKPRKERPWFREKVLGPLDFPKGPDAVGIQCDINFSTTLGIHNTALLRCYSAADKRVRPFILFVKKWASRRKINSGYSGTLSSYGYVLMALHFLVNVASPAVVPNLQLAVTHTRPDGVGGRRIFVEPNLLDPTQILEGCDIRFWRNEEQIRDRASKGFLSHNNDSLGKLLRNFFTYFASQSGSAPRGGFHWMQDVVSLRSPGGVLSKAQKGWTGARTTENSDGKEVRHRYLLALEDPFELDHNVARTVTHHGIVAIRDEFRRVARILERVGRGLEVVEGGILDELVEVRPPPTEDGKDNASVSDVPSHALATVASGSDAATAPSKADEDPAKGSTVQDVIAQMNSAMGQVMIGKPGFS